MARFYVEGDEIDVQDPTFFVQEEHFIEIQEVIADYLSVYA